MGQDDAKIAAQPSTPSQRARRRRILTAALRLTAARGHEQVQMQEIAAEADVALATLYRYFPSKTLLYLTALNEETGKLKPAPDGNPATADEAISQILATATRRFMRMPNIAMAMMHAANIANLEGHADALEVEQHMQDVLLRSAGIDDPTPDDLTLLRLLIQLWYGVLQLCLNGRIDLDEAELDLRRGSELLLRPITTRGTASLPAAGAA